MSRVTSQAHLRAAAGSDIETLLSFMRHFYAEERIAFSEEKARRALHQLLNAPAWGQVYLIEAEREAVGYVVVIFSFILEFGGRQAFVDEFYVRPERRGRGHGAQTLAEIDRLCLASDIHVVRLEVACANAGALSLYERSGFERHDRNTMTKVLSPASQ